VLDGLPKKEVRFTPTQPPVILDPNGEFEVEQMYAQYTLVSDEKKRGAYPLVMSPWWWAIGGDLGDQAGW